MIILIKALVFTVSLFYSISWVKYVSSSLSGKVELQGNPYHGLVATIGWGILYYLTIKY